VTQDRSQSQPHRSRHRARQHGQPGDPHRLGHSGPREVPAELAAILAEIVPPGGAFRHRQHIHLAFLAVQRHGAHAPEVVARWIGHIAAYERAPQKFNATVTRAWTELVTHHVAAGPPGTDFGSFAGRNPALLDKRLLARHYSARVLASPAARTSWVEPDRTPFPWAARPARPSRR
jgi:hypothetical protein